MQGKFADVATDFISWSGLHKVGNNLLAYNYNGIIDSADVRLYIFAVIMRKLNRFLRVMLIIGSFIGTIIPCASAEAHIMFGFYPDYPYLGSYQPDWNALTHISWYKWTLIMRKLNRFLRVMLIIGSFIGTIIPCASAEAHIVFGFYPDYPYLGSYQPDWNALTHISWYKWTLKPDGSFQSTENISNFNIVKTQAHFNKVKVTLCIRGYDSANPNPMENVLAYHQQDCIQNITDLLNSTGADGINIDWEWTSPVPKINPADGKPVKPEFENFIKHLYSTMKTINPNYHLSIDTYSDISSEALFQNTNLSNYIDAIILMDYDMAGSSNSGPNSPCNGSNRYDIGDSIADCKQYYPLNKIILGLPLYGYDYSCFGNNQGASTTARNMITIGDAEKYSQMNESFWETSSRTPWYRYQLGSEWHQVWFDNKTSLSIKYNYSKDKGLAGVGFWALGYEQKDMNVWNIFYLPAFPGCASPPMDHNKDGLYEDINGDGKTDFVDIITYYKNMDWIMQSGLTVYFDYNYNGILDLRDAIYFLRLWIDL
jgi:PKD repeat protein